MKGDPSKVPGPDEGLRVLVVDPAAPVRLLLAESLAEIGRRHSLPIAAYEASDGFEALWQFPRGRFGLVLLSLELPTLSGFDLIRILRARPEQARLPIIAFSGELGAGAAAGVSETGASAFVPTPVGTDALEEALLRAGALAGGRER